MSRIKNKIALITGGASSIGAEIAHLFAKEGALVIVSDIQGGKGQKIAKAAHGHYQHLDVANEQEWQMVSKILKDQYGKIDILVNNAGITGFNEDIGPQDP